MQLANTAAIETRNVARGASHLLSSFTGRAANPNWGRGSPCEFVRVPQ